MRISDWSSDVCSSDLQLISNEQGERFEQDMAVALDAAERHRQPVEALAEFVLQFARGLPVQPGGERIGADRGLGSAGLCGQRFAPGAQILAPESLVTNAWAAGGVPVRSSAPRRSRDPNLPSPPT